MKEKEILEFLKSYIKMGLIVIPINEKGKPFLKYKHIEKNKISELKKWIAKFPTCAWAVVTGQKTNLTIVDCESRQAAKKFRQTYKAIEGIKLDTPAVKSPHGVHYYFQYNPKLKSGIVNPDASKSDQIDIKNNNQLVTIPPSYRKAKQYSWVNKNKIDNYFIDNSLVMMALKKTHIYNVIYGVKRKKCQNDTQPTVNTKNSKRFNDPSGVSNSSKTFHSVSKNRENKSEYDELFKQGSRDKSLFVLTNYLYSGGASVKYIEQIQRFICENMDPPFPLREALPKIDYAIEKAKEKKIDFKKAIHQFISVSNGWFSVSECYQTFHSVSKSITRDRIRLYLWRLSEKRKPIIEKHPEINGLYRRIDNELVEMDLMNVPTEEHKIKLPLGLNQIVTIRPGSLIVVGGVTNAGKSVFLLNTIKLNLHNGYKNFLFNSENTASQVMGRIKCIDPNNYQKNFIDNKCFRSFVREEDYHLVIKKNKKCINYIDYLAVDKDFWQIKTKLEKIRAAQDQAVTIVAIQKNPKAEYPDGGPKTYQPTSLAINLDIDDKDKSTVAQIMKCKEFPNPLKNPYKLIRKYDQWNCIIKPLDKEWKRNY